MTPATAASTTARSITTIDQSADGHEVLLQDRRAAQFPLQADRHLQGGGKDEPAWTTATGEPDRHRRKARGCAVNVGEPGGLPADAVRHGDAGLRKAQDLRVHGRGGLGLGSAAMRRRPWFSHVAQRRRTDRLGRTDQDRDTGSSCRGALPSIGKLGARPRLPVDFAARRLSTWRWSAGRIVRGRKTITLSKDTVNAVWSVPIGDRTQRRYHRDHLNLAGKDPGARRGDSEGVSWFVTGRSSERPFEPAMLSCRFSQKQFPTESVTVFKDKLAIRASTSSPAFRRSGRPDNHRCSS